MNLIPMSLALLMVMTAENATAQTYVYDTSSKNPFGLLNPEASAETADFAHLIGESTCQSVKRID